MKIAITGALGHIGSKFIHGMRPGQFQEIRLIDSIATQRYVSLFNLPQGVDFRFFEEDINSADLNRLFQGIDVVIHLAAITDATSSFGKEEEVELVNYSGTARVAQACVENGCKLIFPSTTSVYGTQEEVVDEECPIEGLKPQSPYAASKLRAEHFLKKLGHERNLRYVIFRLGTIFGTSIGMRFHTAINKFCWQACLRKPITVWRTALNQRRPYLDLSDAVASFLYVIDRDLFMGQIYNVVTVNATVGEIVEVIRKFIPDLTVDYVDSRIMNQLSYHVLNDKFKGTGFHFSGDLEKGISGTLNLLRGIQVK